MSGVIKLVANASDSRIVDAIVETLERAKKGDVLGVAIVEVHRGGDVMITVPPTSRYHALNSGAARLAHTLAGCDD